MTEKYLDTPRGRVFYLISDEMLQDRETLFFFHGLTADHRLFEKQTAYFDGRYNVIAWDAPLHGRSRPYKDFSFKNAAEDIKAILKENDAEEIIAVGQSLGGYYAQAFMLRYPSAVKGFVGIGTTPYGDMYYSAADKFWLCQIEWMGLLCPEVYLKRAAAKQACVTEYAVNNMLEMISCYDKREYCHLMQTAYSAFLEDNRDIDICCPVLITHGEKDRVGTVRKYCRMWTEKTGFPLKIISRAGHNANADAPDEMNRIIEEFIAGLK